MEFRLSEFGLTFARVLESWEHGNNDVSSSFVNNGDARVPSPKTTIFIAGEMSRRYPRENTLPDQLRDFFLSGQGVSRQ
jgi:hypothetical protein